MVGGLLVGIKDINPGFRRNRRRIASLRGPWLPTANPARNSPTTMGNHTSSAASLQGAGKGVLWPSVSEARACVTAETGAGELIYRRG